jgi:uncharacterized C2H2 Zn-finger protein
MNWQQQIDTIKCNTDFEDYFNSTNTNLVDFLNSYIQVDKILKVTAKEPSPSEITSLLKNLQVLHENKNNEMISVFKNIQSDIGNLKIQLENSLRNITNTEIKDLVNGLLDKNSDKQFLQNISDKIVNLNSQNLNEFDRKTLSIIQNMQTTFNSSLDSHTITSKIHDMDSILTSLYNKFNSNSSKKGEYAENILFANLVKEFQDSEVILTRFESDAADIQIKKDNRPLILIDSKHIESKNVPKIDLEKFHENCKVNNASGILCNAFGGIANKSNFQIDIIDKNIMVYIWNHEFDSTLFKIATRIIYNIYDIIKTQTTDNIKIDQILFKKLKLEYNFFLQNFQQHLSVIKTNIKSLEALSLTQLEQFFKRTNFNSEEKPFTCSNCGTSFIKDKYLREHLTKIHGIELQKSKRGRKKVEVVEEPIEIEEQTEEPIEPTEFDEAQDPPNKITF